MARSVTSIAVGNLISKGLGLLREVLFASWFGTGPIAAAFRVAQTAYLLPTQALVGDTLSAGMIPYYQRLRREDGRPDDARTLVVLAVLYGTIFSLAATVLLYAFADGIAHTIAPGMSASAHATSVGLLRVLALATPFYILGGVFGYVEAAHGRFGAIAWRPALLNIGSIAGAGAAVYTHQDHWLASGLVVSHIAILIWTVASLRLVDRLTPAVWPRLTVVRGIAGRLARNMATLLGLPLIAQINVVVERIVSSHLGTAVIPSVDYARTIADTVVNLIAMPLGVLTLSAHGGSVSQEARRHVETVAAAIMLVAFPLALVIACNARELVILLFARGKFDAQSVETTSAILRWMGGALGATVTGYYLIKALNAQLRNVEALLLTAVAGVANMGVNLSLWRSFGPSTVGIGVAVFNAIILGGALWRLGMLGRLRTTLAWVAAGCLAQMLACSVLVASLSGLGGLVASVMASALIWGCLIRMAAPLRAAAAPLLLRIASLIPRARRTRHV